MARKGSKKKIGTKLRKAAKAGKMIGKRLWKKVTRSGTGSTGPRKANKRS